jgi:hypothetical protein
VLVAKGLQLDERHRVRVPTDPVALLVELDPNGSIAGRGRQILELNSSCRRHPSVPERDAVGDARRSRMGDARKQDDIPVAGHDAGIREGF